MVIVVVVVVTLLSFISTLPLQSGLIAERLSPANSRLVPAPLQKQTVAALAFLAGFKICGDLFFDITKPNVTKDTMDTKDSKHHCTSLAKFPSLCNSTDSTSMMAP